MSLTKEECLKAHYELSNILVETDYIDGRAFCTYPIMEDELGTMYQLIEEHFELVDKYNELEKQHMKLLSQWGKSDNPPLKFEELHEGMWVWDNDIKKYLKIVDVIGWDEDDDEPAFLIVFEPNEYDCWVENRFYRYQVD